MLIADKFSPLWVKTVQSAGKSANPQSTTAVLIYFIDKIVTQTMRVLWIMAKMCELAGFAVEPVQPTGAGTNPQIT